MRLAPFFQNQNRSVTRPIQTRTRRGDRRPTFRFALQPTNYGKTKKKNNNKEQMNERFGGANLSFLLRNKRTSNGYRQCRLSRQRRCCLVGWTSTGPCVCCGHTIFSLSASRPALTRIGHTHTGMHVYAHTIQPEANENPTWDISM